MAEGTKTPAEIEEERHAEQERLEAQLEQEAIASYKPVPLDLKKCGRITRPPTVPDDRYGEPITTRGRHYESPVPEVSAPQVTKESRLDKLVMDALLKELVLSCEPLARIYGRDPQISSIQSKPDGRWMVSLAFKPLDQTVKSDKLH